MRVEGWGVVPVEYYDSFMCNSQRVANRFSAKTKNDYIIQKTASIRCIPARASNRFQL